MTKPLSTTRALPFVLSFALTLLAVSPEVALAAEQGAPAQPKPPLLVESIEVRPPSPGPDTLCQLRLRVKNTGSRQASALGFAVRLNGQELTVYRNQLYLQTIEPGAVAEVKLYNFWTSETSRPAPADGKLVLEVELKEARWVEVKTAGGAEVWRPTGAVEGLPSKASLTLDLRAGRKP